MSKSAVFFYVGDDKLTRAWRVALRALMKIGTRKTMLFDNQIRGPSKNK